MDWSGPALAVGASLSALMVTVTVSIDGVPLGQLQTGRWRALIGYVPQEMLLLHDTIHMNVTLGDPAISDTQVEEALRDAGGRIHRRTGCH